MALPEFVILCAPVGRASLDPMAVIEPEIAAVRAKMAALTGSRDVTQLPPAEGRALIDKAALSLGDRQPAMERIIEHQRPGLLMRSYLPFSRRSRAIIYFLHGGGWFAGSIETHDRMVRYLAEQSKTAVVSASYRLAPENPFPAALDDVEACWAELMSHAASWDLDESRLVFAGDSAGANLALALALRLRSRKAPMPLGLALLYGTLTPGLQTSSYKEYGTGAYGLTTTRMEWYWSNYLGGTRSVEATPIDADLSGLPPIFLGIAEADPVADDSRLLAQRLTAAGVPSELVEWRGATHGFLQMTRDVALARCAVRDIAAAIVKWLG